MSGLPLSPTSALLCMVLRRRTFFCLLFWKDTRVVSCLNRNFESPSGMCFFSWKAFGKKRLFLLIVPTYHCKFVFCEGFGQFQICEIIVTGDIATTEILCKCRYDVCSYPKVSFSGFCTCCRLSKVESASKWVVC